LDLLILGASARSAAFSALRLGLTPICADLFADADLTSCCRSARIDPSSYPDGLASFADGIEPTPWLYTGAIENRADLVERISSRHPLLGNPASTLRAVRDPLALAEVFRDSGLVAPGVRREPTGLPRDGSWLVKPMASGGGRGIRPFSGDPPISKRPVYYQERIDGLSLAALFEGDNCLGITRQYVGRPGRRYAYRGSLGPWPVSGEVREQVERLGRAISSNFRLQGLFGIDLILGAGRVWPIEVNPRYTASVEVLEWALGRSLLADHLGAFGLGVENPPEPPRVPAYVGKTILFADRPGVWSPPGTLRLTRPDRFPEIADIPEPGTGFQPGDPVLTVFACGDSPEDCRRLLARHASRWRGLLREMTT
jgi:uncharacterized protein